MCWHEEYEEPFGEAQSDSIIPALSKTRTLVISVIKHVHAASVNIIHIDDIWTGSELQSWYASHQTAPCWYIH